MTDPDAGPFAGREFLTLRIGGQADIPERLLLVGRPHDGVVHVHEWSTRTMNQRGEDYLIDAQELLEQVEEAYAANLAVSEEMYRVRTWLARDGGD